MKNLQLSILRISFIKERFSVMLEGENAAMEVKSEEIETTEEDKQQIDARTYALTHYLNENVKIPLTTFANQVREIISKLNPDDYDDKTFQQIEKINGYINTIDDFFLSVTIPKLETTQEYLDYVIESFHSFNTANDQTLVKQATDLIPRLVMGIDVLKHTTKEIDSSLECLIKAAKEYEPEKHRDALHILPTLREYAKTHLEQKDAVLKGKIKIKDLPFVYELCPDICPEIQIRNIRTLIDKTLKISGNNLAILEESKLGSLALKLELLEKYNKSRKKRCKTSLTKTITETLEKIHTALEIRELEEIHIAFETVLAINFGAINDVLDFTEIEINAINQITADYEKTKRALDNKELEQVISLLKTISNTPDKEEYRPFIKLEELIAA